MVSYTGVHRPRDPAMAPHMTTHPTLWADHDPRIRSDDFVFHMLMLIIAFEEVVWVGDCCNECLETWMYSLVNVGYETSEDC